MTKATQEEEMIFTTEPMQRVMRANSYLRVAIGLYTTKDKKGV